MSQKVGISPKAAALFGSHSFGHFATLTIWSFLVVPEVLSAAFSHGKLPKTLND